MTSVPQPAFVTHLVISIHGQVELRLLFPVQLLGQAEDATDRVDAEVTKRVTQGILHLVVDSWHITQVSEAYRKYCTDVPNQDKMVQTQT